MKFTKRDITVIGTFAGVLAIAGFGYYRKQTTTAATASPAGRVASARDPNATFDENTPGSAGSGAGPVTLPERGYQDFATIPERNLFQPLIKDAPEKKPAGPAVVPPAPAPAPGPLPAPAATQPQPPPKVSDTIAVTGCVTVRDVQVALVENVTTKETQLARVGTEAFGYVVASVNDEGAVLRKDGQDHFFAIGANKPAERAAPKKEEKKDDKKDETKPDSSATPPPTPPAPSASGGFDFRNLTPEQREEFRRRWEDRRRSFGGGGGYGGGR